MNAQKVDELRALLFERFPESRPTAPVFQSVLSTGIKTWDALTGGLRRGEVSEVCGYFGSTSLVLEKLLAAATQAGWLGAWVDAGDALEVADWNEEMLRRMVWVRCPDTPTAMRAADLLLRDGNLCWVVLDLQCCPLRALRKIPAHHWHRFHRLTNHHQTALVVLSPAPLVEGTRVRIVGPSPWPLDSLCSERNPLHGLNQLRVHIRGLPPSLHPLPEIAALPSKRSPSCSTVPVAGAEEGLW